VWAPASEQPPEAHLQATEAAGDCRPEISVREVLAVTVGGLVLAILTTWPLLIHLSSRVAPDLGDPIRTAWQVAEQGHALLSHPLSFFSTNAFWPHAHSLTFSDILLGYSPTGLIGSGTGAALARYNLLFLFAWTLPVMGAYLLARELGLRRGAAGVAGVAFAYAPFKAAEAGHLHVISSGAIPLAIFLLWRGYRRQSATAVAAGWLAAAWQLSLGFTLGLPFSYTLLVLGAIAAVLWWRRGRRPLTRGVVIASALGVGLYLALGLFIARPYLQTARTYPSAHRATTEIRKYSAGPRAFLAAPRENRIWGAATRSIRYHLRSQNESVLFPGLAIAALALVGLSASVYQRRLRAGLLAGTLLFATLALGFGLLPGGYPYRLLYDYLPGWNGVRVPGRMYSMTALGLSLLAGAGAHRLLGSTASALGRGVAARRPSGSALAGALAAVLCAVVVIEGAGRQAHQRVPPSPIAVAALPGPQLWLPTDESNDRLFQFWSSAGFPAIVNGVSTFDLPALDDLRGGMQNFPDASGVRKLQRLGIRTVILDTALIHIGLPVQHYAIPEPPDPLAAARRPIAGLPLTRRIHGPLVIYTIEPPRRSS
jgi:hypothetical protein